MLNNIQIYLIKAEDPVIINTYIGKQKHTAKENWQGKCLVELKVDFLLIRAWIKWSRLSFPKIVTTKVFIILQSVSSYCSYRHILANRTGTCSTWHNIKHERRATHERSECSADLEPVVWVQDGTFGYIDKHSNSTGNQRSVLLHLRSSNYLEVV